MDIETGTQLKNEKSAELSKINSLFQIISAWALGEKDLESLGGALPAPLPEWPEEIKKIWKELNNIETKELAGNLVNDYSVPTLVARELDNLDERALYVAEERILTTRHSVTLEELGNKLGVTRERVRQLEQKAIQKLKRFKEEEYLPVFRRARLLHNQLGSAVPMNDSSIEDALMWAVEDFDEYLAERTIAKKLLLWRAGPYNIHRNWLLSDKKLPTKTITKFLECQDQRGIITLEAAHKAMNGLGIKTKYHRAWIDHLGKFLQLDEGLISFDGNALDKSISLLRYSCRPMTAEEILEYISSDSSVNIRYLRDRLISDLRFWRINRQGEFVLAGTEGYDEYTGIIDEIVQELELCGGQASVTHLVEKISSTYGVKETSVLLYLNAPMFIKDKNEIVRVRNIEKGFNITTKDLTKSKACYFSDKGTWCFRIKIDTGAMRGSGRTIPNAFASQIGCSVGKKIEVPTELGQIIFSWPITSLNPTSSDK